MYNRFVSNNLVSRCITDIYVYVDISMYYRCVYLCISGCIRDMSDTYIGKQMKGYYIGQSL